MAKRLEIFLSSFLPLLFVFIASLYRPYDPDLGWHLKYGEYFFKYGKILKENIFATDMPHYHWINLSWGVDLLYFVFYHFGGFLGLTLVSAAIVALTCYFFAKAFELDYFEKAIIFPLIVYFEQPVVEVSFRGQLVSIFLLSVLIFLLMSYERKRNNKILFFIPLLFMLWSNLHGQFVMGLGIFGLWVLSFLVSEAIKVKLKWRALLPQIKILSIIGLFSAIGTLVNPFGIGIYTETARYLHSPLLKDVTEYLPPDQLSSIWWNHIIVGFIAGTGIIIYFFRDKLKTILSSLSIFSVLYILSYLVKRYAWMMYYFIIPFIKPLAAFLKPDSKKAAFWGATILFFIAIGVTLILKFPFSQFSTMSWEIYCREYQGCSSKGAEYVNSLSRRGNLMNLYGWGGWLIWNYPDIKPSIDGRMHLWRDSRGSSSFETYYAYEQNLKDVDQSTYDTVFMNRSKPVYRRLLQLTREGKWKLVYQDNLSAVFIRNKNL